jgi:hypothetical protein
MTMQKILLFVFVIFALYSCDKAVDNSSTNKVDSTQLKTKSFVELAKPNNRNYGHGKFFRSCLELNDGKILVAGGYTYNDMNQTLGILPTELYDPIINKWETLKALKDGTQGNDRLILLKDGRALFKYGASANNSTFSYGNIYFSIFDPISKQWTEKNHPNSLVDRSPIQDCCVMDDGKVFVLAVDYHYIWDPATDTFSKQTKNTVAAELSRAIKLNTGEILVCGGVNMKTKKPSNYAFLYPSYKTSTMLTGRSTFDVIVAPNNNVYIVTQANRDFQLYSEPQYDYYDYASNTWYPLSIELASFGHAFYNGIAHLGNNKYVIYTVSGNGYLGIGFYDMQNQSTFIFNQFVNTFKPILQKGLSMINLRNGKIFMLGYDPTNSLSDCILYDSKSDFQ